MARRPGKTIDFKQWRSIASTNFTGSVNAVFVGPRMDFVDPATILRARSKYMVLFDPTKQVADQMTVTLALGVVSTDAAGLGSTAMPDPVSDSDYPWLWWGTTVLESQIAAGEDAFGSTVQLVEVDTKAMRRVKPKQSLVWVAEMSGAAGAPVTKVFMHQTRVLVGT